MGGDQSLSRRAFGAWLLVAAAHVHGCKSAPPAGVPGPEADVLAKEMQAAVGAPGWRRTGAVQWTFAEKNRHLWDRHRGFSRVEWEEHRVLLDIDGRRGLAFTEGKRVQGADASARLDEAHAKWTNDAFWLNPVAKAFDPGTVRELVPPEDGRRGLLVRYISGGRTPGDAYLWWVDDKGRPVAWQMWTSNIPVGGVTASWEEWVELATGAQISTRHETNLFTLVLSDVAGAEELSKLYDGEDPFATLAACIEADDCVRF